MIYFTKGNILYLFSLFILDQLLLDTEKKQILLNKILINQVQVFTNQNQHLK